MDRYRDPKEKAKQVLLERLAMVDPFKYDKSIYDTNPYPMIHPISETIPSWRHATIQKHRERFGIYRGLRPASAIEPLNNNLDLDYPNYPHGPPEVRPLNQPVKYMYGKGRKKPIRITHWVKPANEHSEVDIHNIGALSEEDRKKYLKN